MNYFKDYTEMYLGEDLEELDARYQIVMPYVLRGFLIHLLNDSIEDKEFLNELYIINQLLASLVNSYKDAAIFFERYL